MPVTWLETIPFHLSALIWRWNTRVVSLMGSVHSCKQKARAHLHSLTKAFKSIFKCCFCKLPSLRTSGCSLLKAVDALIEGEIRGRPNILICFLTEGSVWIHWCTCSVPCKGQFHIFFIWMNCAPPLSCSGFVWLQLKKTPPFKEFLF